MVLFKCKTCAASVMHRDVDKHVVKCSGPLALKCIDCNNDFFGQQYAAHSSCARQKMAELPTVPVVPTIPTTSMGPTATMERLDVTKNLKAPKVKGGKRVKNKSLSRTAPTEHSIKLQEQWKQAGLVASQDPSLTEQQKALLVNACKQPGPLQIRGRTIKKALHSTNHKLMTSLRLNELVGEVLRMIESEFKKINRPQKKDDMKLTKNQKLIGSILTASETPGMQPNHKSLLATIAEDKSKLDRLLNEYVRVTYDACHHRIESVASHAFKKFEAEFIKINGRKPVSKLQKRLQKKKKNADIKKIIGKVNVTEDKQQINGLKEVESKPKEKKDKRKKQKDVDETMENEIDEEDNNVDKEIDSTFKKSKKRKHHEEGQNGEALSTGKDHEDAALEIEAAHKKSKKENKRSKSNGTTDEEMVNGSANVVSDNSAGKKIKRHKKVKMELTENDGSTNGTAAVELIEDAELSRKKKKHKRQNEAEEDGERRKMGKIKA